MPVFTKRAVDIFNPVDGIGNARGPNMGEVQIWGAEVEAFIETIEGVRFLASKNGVDQSISSATETKITFAAESVDVGGYYDAGNSRFSPTEAGVYLIGASLYFSGGLVADNGILLKLFANGSLLRQKTVIAGAANESIDQVWLINADGATYYEIYAEAAGVGSKTVYGGTHTTQFWAARLDGLKGDPGPNAGLVYQFNTATSGDPGAGKLLVNNITPASITQINISESNRSGVSQAAFLALQDNSTSTIRSIVRIVDVQDPATNFIELGITGALTDVGGYDTFPVSYIGHGGTIANDAEVSIVFFTAGNKGDPGTDGVDGTSAMSRVRVVDSGSGDPSTAYEAGDTVDSIVLAQNDVVLRATPAGDSDDGLYLVPASGAASRLTAFNAYDSMPGCYFSVMEGTTYEDTLWRCTSDKGGTLGVDDLVFSQFSNSGGGRYVLLSNSTYYVRTDGDDANDGKTNSSGGAWLTIQHALDYILANIDLNGYTVTIRVANGTYAEAVMVFGDFVGGANSSPAPVKVKGDTTTPSNVVIQPSSGKCFTVSFGARLSIEGLKLVGSTANDDCLYASAQGIIYISGNTEFGAAGASKSHMWANSMGQIITSSSYIISGNCNTHYYASQNGVVEVVGSTITINSTPTINYFAFARGNGTVYLNSHAFSGSVSGGIKYLADYNGFISSIGVTIPGGTGGSVDHGGQYEA